MSDILDKNLSNVKSETDLFGNEIKKLSMKDRIGFSPLSIWQPDWTKVKELKEIVGDKAETRGESSYGFQDMQSIFNPHLAQMILSAYCPASANIFDPFGGGGTRGFIANAMGHMYTGIELRQEEVDRIVAKQDELNRHFDIICGDSRKPHVKEESFNFCYTCPPYYNLEVYSDQEADLSNLPQYGSFLRELRESVKQSFMALKPGSLSVWVVGNFRDKDGYLIHFNSDLIWIAKECGYKLHDEIIFWGASGNASQRCGQFEANRKSVRVHEYLVILKKP